MFKFKPKKVLPTKRYVMDEITFEGQREPVVLVVKPATEANERYFNRILKLSATAPKRKTTPTVASVKKAREEDKEVFAKYGVVMGWENVIDSAPEGDRPAEPTADNFHEFLKGVPDEAFDRLRRFVVDIMNFYVEDEEEPDAEELLKN